MKRFAILLLVALFSTVGCGAGDESENETDSSASTAGDENNGPSSSDDDGVASDDSDDSNLDQQLAALADELDMSIDDLRMKNQMMIDAGMSQDEILKVMSMGGDPSSLFKDDADSNVSSPQPQSIRDLTFVSDDESNNIKLEDFIGESNVVLVFMRGYSGGMICPFCTTQTAQLAANYDEFIARDANVLIIYPGSTEHLSDFVAAASNVDREQADIEAVRWPVLIDPDLAAVNLLDIAADLAQPSTFIIDKQGNVVFAYVGANRTDRPSVKLMLRQLDAIAASGE